MSLLHKRLLFAGLLTASLVVAGCNASSNKYSGRGDTENLLTSQNQQLQTPLDPNDPVAAHLAARAQVDPKDLSTHHAYTTTPTAEEVDRDTNVRVVRLETQVADLRSDFKKLIPNISKSSEEAVQTANVAPMQMSNAPIVADTMPEAVPVPQQKPTAPETIMPAAGNASVATTSDVTGVRVGEHSDRTRLVFDMNAPGKFSYDIDAAGTTLTVRLPQSGWTAETQKTLAESAMIRGYSAGPATDGGTAVNISLKKPGKLTLSDALPPNEVYGNRIVFDVAPL